MYSPKRCVDACNDEPIPSDEYHYLHQKHELLAVSSIKADVLHSSHIYNICLTQQSAIIILNKTTTNKVNTLKNERIFLTL